MAFPSRPEQSHLSRRIWDWDALTLSRVSPARYTHQTSPFIDIHKEILGIPAEMVQQVQDRIASGAKDKFGATALDVLASIDGSAFCITDAPMNLTLLRSVNSHTSKSVSMGTEDVHEVISMGGKL